MSQLTLEIYSITKYKTGSYICKHNENIFIDSLKKSILHRSSKSVSNRDEVRYENEGLFSSTKDFQRQLTVVA